MCGYWHANYYDKKVRRVRDLSCGDTHIYLEVEVRRVACRRCGTVKREQLDWLADNPFYTKRFAFYVGRRCRAGTIKDVARELGLDWHTVKELEKQYMREQLRRIGQPGPKVIGIDEISIRKGHTYRIVVSDLLRLRPIWFGGLDRSEESMGLFYAELSERKRKGIYLAVMDMWKPFRKAAKAHIPQARILFDKFHVMQHLGQALDEVRKSEYARLTGSDRRFIKGQKYTLLSNRENLTLEGRRALAKLLKVNKRLNIAYLLKETFDQLWDYEREGWARRFFENWKSALKWQRLKPYEKFVKLIERHWDGIAAHCDPRNKVSLGFVEGFNNKIRVIQRRAYGLRDEEYLRLKILTCMLPEI
jgi:transposase